MKLKLSRSGRGQQYSFDNYVLVWNAARVVISLKMSHSGPTGPSSRNPYPFPQPEGDLQFTQNSDENGCVAVPSNQEVNFWLDRHLNSTFVPFRTNGTDYSTRKPWPLHDEKSSTTIAVHLMIISTLSWSRSMITTINLWEVTLH